MLQKAHGANKIMIVDWDVHHGNGTQHMFIEDPNVLYVSIHRYDQGDFFPGSTDADLNVVGKGSGVGRNINIPWSDEEMGDGEYLAAFHRVVLPIGYEFAPDMVIVSAGFDAAVDDPIGEYMVSPECYAHMTHMLMGLANGKVLLCLEGGYSLKALPLCATNCLKALLGEPLPLLSPSFPSLGAMITLDSVCHVQSKFWKCFGKSKDFIDRSLASLRTI